MKKALSYMMLVVYTTMLLKPVSPFIADFMAHLFQYEEHVMTVHYEHGKYHVHEEYKEIAKKAPVDKESAQQKKDQGSPEFTIIKEIAYNMESRFRLPGYCYFSFNLSGRDLPHDYPPPRC